MRQSLWNGARRALIRVRHDPACSASIHGQILHLPLSHELPAYLRLLPLYDSLPGRLSTHLHNQHGAIRGLDIGANIGDSIAALRQSAEDRFLAVEPNEKFERFLHENWDTPQVKIQAAVCASQPGKGRFQVAEHFGTASFMRNRAGREYRITSVDELLMENPEFRSPDLVKIDTDGNDFEVIRGAKQTLQSLPAVLFECDVFGNGNYVEDCLGVLELFRSTGYRSMLVYEKFGYPLGRFELQDLERFKELLFFQLTKKYIYYDILVMREEELTAFHATEIAFFLGQLERQGLRTTAEKLFAR